MSKKGKAERQSTCFLHEYYKPTSCTYCLPRQLVLHVLKSTIRHPVIPVLAGSVEYCHFGQLKFIFPLSPGADPETGECIPWTLDWTGGLDYGLNSGLNLD